MMTSTKAHDARQAFFKNRLAKLEYFKKFGSFAGDRPNVENN